MRSTWFESAVVASLQNQSRVADKKLAASSTHQLDTAYLVNEISTQAQALTLIRCAMTSPQRDNTIAVLVGQLETRVKTNILSAVKLRQDLGLPDNGEATVIGCTSMCATPKSGESAPSLPESLKAAICF